MKKQLLCTSAIALGVAAAPAAAQDWNLDWGGFYNTHVAYADTSVPVGLQGFLGTVSPLTGGAPTFLYGGVGADFDGMNVVGNGEIIFTPSITLDNGMTFGINVQMEAQNGGGGADGIDESYVFVSSDTLGRIEMGGENSAGYKLMVGAPTVGSFGINSGSVSTVSPLIHPFRQAGGSAFTEVAGNNDVQRISYFTPDFNGFTAGISYAPGVVGNASNTGAFNRNSNVSDVFDIGLNYSGTFGTTTVVFGARYGTGEATATNKAAGQSDPETWGVGFQVGFGAFTVGAHYAENDNGWPGGNNGLPAPNTTSRQTAAARVGAMLAAADQESFGVGVTYDLAGPWSIGLEGFFGEADLTGIVPGNKAEYNAYKLAGSREIGPGVSMDLYFIGAENDIKGIGKVDTNIFGTSLNLSF